MKKQKQKSKKKKHSSAAKPIFAALVIFTGIYIAAKTVGSVAMSNVSDAFVSFASSVRSGGGYPYSTPGKDISDMKKIGSGILLVSPDAISTLSFSAAELQSIACSYSDPAVCANNGRAIVYDRNTNKFCVISKTRLLYSGETKGAVLTAAMGKNGFAAVAFVSDKSASELTVYDRGMKEHFKWECVSDYIVDMSISGNGKNIAVIVLGVKDAEICSKLHVFQMGSPEPLASFEYSKTTLIDVQYTKKKQIIAIGDNLRSVISRDMSRNDEQFSGDEVRRFASAENGRQAVVLLPYGDENSAKFRVYAEDGSKSFEESFKSKVTDAACGSSCAAALTKDGVFVFNSAGKEIYSKRFSETAVSLELTDKDIYILFNDRIEKHSIYGKSSKTKNS